MKWVVAALHPGLVAAVGVAGSAVQRLEEMKREARDEP